MKGCCQISEEILEEMNILERQTATYEGINMKWVPPVLKVGERELILVTHNECIFYSYDRKRGIWLYDGMMPLCKKENGKLIMVSEFVSEACGRLQLSEKERENYRDIPAEARCYLTPSKN